MGLTNRYGFPEAIVRAMRNDKYDKAGSDFSATELLKPARARALSVLHADQIEEDVSDKVYALLGQATHSILERAARSEDLVEQRFFGTFMDVTVSAQIDLLEHDTQILSDWKVTKAYPFTTKGGLGQKPEWIQQLNIGLELLRMNGLDAKGLQIIGIIRDFDQRCLDMSSRQFMAGYPKSEIVSIDIPIWPREQTLAFISSRVSAHVDAMEKLPSCSVEETWGGRRCARYCNVNKFCDQYQTAKQTGILQKERQDAISTT